MAYRYASGISNDVRTLLASAAPEAKQAIDYFVYHTKAFRHPRCALHTPGAPTLPRPAN